MYFATSSLYNLIALLKYKHYKVFLEIVWLENLKKINIRTTNLQPELPNPQTRNNLQSMYQYIQGKR